MDSDTTFDEDEYKIDLSVMVAGDSGSIPVTQQDDDEITPTQSPIKRRRQSPSKKSMGLMDTIPRINFAGIPSLAPTDHNELFQVTQKKFSFPAKNSLPGLDDLFPGKGLNNDKIDRMVNEMGLKFPGEFELDDQMRTRFYKGRFKGQSSIDNNDDIDIQMSNYLDDDENKENQNFEPLKAKNASSIKKSNRVLFKTPRRHTQIPILKPLLNLTNVEAKNDLTKSDFQVKTDSPKRICIPKHRVLTANKSSLKCEPHQIYIVESLTGLINDATKFGTELNASNGEDFPLPEDVNEVVQIPTNEDPHTKVQKMAIIKVVRPEREDKGTGKNGFYSSKEWERYREGSPDDLGVEVVSQNVRKVRFADELEW